MNDEKISSIVSLITHFLDQCNFQKSTYEDFLEAFMESVRATAGKENLLCGLWDSNEYSSQSCVLLLRLLTSAYLQLHSQEYISFIAEEFIAGSENDSMKQYCQKNVECMGVESDQIHIVALCNALRSRVNIVYIDGSASNDFTPLEFGDSAERDEVSSCMPFPLMSISMLYRPGHYDLLY
jgi:ubiquitin thioesterase protein OTUB1